MTKITKNEVSDADQNLVSHFLRSVGKVVLACGILVALMTSKGRSHLKQGSRSVISMRIIESTVPSNARLFLVLVLFSPTTENTLSASALEWGNTRTSLATAAS